MLNASEGMDDEPAVLFCTDTHITVTIDFLHTTDLDCVYQAIINKDITIVTV